MIQCCLVKRRRTLAELLFVLATLSGAAGQRIKLVFKGQGPESEIQFTMGLDDGSWSTGPVVKQTLEHGLHSTPSLAVQLINPTV